MFPSLRIIKRNSQRENCLKKSEILKLNSRKKRSLKIRNPIIVKKA
jgi:hypothetical protein